MFSTDRQFNSNRFQPIIDGHPIEVVDTDCHLGVTNLDFSKHYVRSRQKAQDQSLGFVVLSGNFLAQFWKNCTRAMFARFLNMRPLSGMGCLRPRRLWLSKGCRWALHFAFSVPTGIRLSVRFLNDWSGHRFVGEGKCFAWLCFTGCFTIVSLPYPNSLHLKKTEPHMLLENL